MKNIAIVGAGYVGLSLGVLLAKYNSVIFLENDNVKIDEINKKNSYLKDEDLELMIKSKNLMISATDNKQVAYANNDFVILCLPTDFSSDINAFDTSTIERELAYISDNNITSPVYIKSTVPIGFTERMRVKFKNINLYFSPEFLREGRSVYDNLYPSRVIVGGDDENCIGFSRLLQEIALKAPKIIFMNSSEAESVKLFANTYLAMRVSFFNELDTFAKRQGLNARHIIEGVCEDDRIGNFYNNPSFGYGGYCLPKDSQQLISHFDSVPSALIKSIHQSNIRRKQFIVDEVLASNFSTIGIYGLTMKAGSDNFRDAAIIDIAKALNSKNHTVYIYEPLLLDASFEGLNVVANYEDFISKIEVVVANRLDQKIELCGKRVLTADLFGNG